MSRPVRPAARVLAAVALAGAAACGGPPAPAPPAETAPPSGSAGGPSTGQAERALLTVTDLPLGFQAQDGAADPAALGCTGVDRVYLAGGATDRAAASFGHALSSTFVNETITTRPGGGAAAALAAFGQAARDCASFTGPDGTAYRVAPLDLPRYGDGSAAVRVSSALREARPVDLVAVRRGDTIVAVATAGAGAEDGQLTRTVVDRALAKLDRTR